MVLYFFLYNFSDFLYNFYCLSLFSFSYFLKLKLSENDKCALPSSCFSSILFKFFYCIFR